MHAMSDVLDVLGRAVTPKAIAALAPHVGLPPAQADKLVKAVIPWLVEQLRNNATAGHSETIAGALAKDHDGGLLDIAESFLGGGFRAGPGDGILGHVFGDQFDGVVARVAASTGLPPAAVRTGFQAIAPLAMGAITKAALGGITAMVVIKLLDVAVDGVRSGKVHSVIGTVNHALDADHDGRALDDVGRAGVNAVKSSAGAVVSASKAVVANPTVRAAAAKSVDVGKSVAVAAANGVKKQAGKLFGKLFGR
jgi:Bacterial protein of unknown function (DUF937)